MKTNITIVVLVQLVLGGSNAVMVMAQHHAAIVRLGSADAPIVTPSAKL